MNNVVPLPTAKTSRTVHEVPEDFNPETGLYLNREEHWEAEEAFLICASMLRMLHDRCIQNANDVDEDWYDAANVITAIQGQLKRIGNLTGK